VPPWLNAPNSISAVIPPQTQLRRQCSTDLLAVLKGPTSKGGEERESGRIGEGRVALQLDWRLRIRQWRREGKRVAVWG